ncbi:hypothetical protein [Oenococcus oeni]|uniref:Uncharacterized protein n=1 Tax=Oenococcus oeni TaxID=1247 RepID=A0AAQ2UQE3_OENOE|nr:hypothetical protein [Oenococcus oeni]SYW05916.1 hypothetical protein OENI_80019 [Oenococcus oeni]SYW06417.1 hypothetical protein OENI_240003 [Oenococcus oeni]SYW13194.1 hypothetical protein OENI_70119 [Oenococcus oeni]SYW15708.1 hypothetical protein OENI_130019 [Oenococcus oeni]VDB97021.1 protein of unknown function [Oenococcus oeni]
MLIKNMPDVPNGFDVITNSHDGLNFDGITRCFKNGGLFITEQVGATKNYSLSSFLTDNYIPAHPENVMVNVISKLVERGFQILKSNSFYLKFGSVMLAHLFIMPRSSVGNFLIFQC